ncbi:hypothetical protein ONZ45_g6861 [Pleurotus djamor]|nr:hypothetical protein ONZ45_g6861 [Pleurotus djamor]
MAAKASLTADVFAPDDPRGFSLSFNAGVLILQPSSHTLSDMLSKLETANYPLEQAEQSFLNAYFASKRVLLPYAYNAGIVIKRRSPALWDELKTNAKIVHFTNVKPYLVENQDPTRILTEVEVAEAMEDASRRKDVYAEEIGWWKGVYESLLRDRGHEMRRCRTLS